MAKGYWITLYRSVSNPDALKQYAALAGPAIVAGGGRFLVRGTPARTVEAGISDRTVVIEFESVEKAIATYNGPDYQVALKALGNAAVRDVRFAEGFSG
ncbi:MAG TPA: DUF1330 domain-containing protein [Candidatus Acidoferrales bacterium]|nr:DUF1330 domain-containing protein [Candidatus Acidoferrales bacterium]